VTNQHVKRLFLGVDSVLDLVVLMDSSDDIEPETWLQMKRYVLEATKEYNLSPSSVRVALVNAGEDAQLVLPLDKGISKVNILKKVSDMKRINGEFDVDSAFNLINSHLDENKNRKAAKVVMNLINGKLDPNQLNKMEKRVKELEMKDITIKSLKLPQDNTELPFKKLAMSNEISTLFNALTKATGIQNHLFFLFARFTFYI